MSSPSLKANSRWLSALHMVVYMFQCFSLNSSNPLLTHHVPSFSERLGWAGGLKHAKPAGCKTLARAQLCESWCTNKPGAASGVGSPENAWESGSQPASSSAPLTWVAWASTLCYSTVTECRPFRHTLKLQAHTVQEPWKGAAANQGLLLPEAAVPVSLQTKTLKKKRAT